MSKATWGNHASFAPEDAEPDTVPPDDDYEDEDEPATVIAPHRVAARRGTIENAKMPSPASPSSSASPYLLLPATRSPRSTGMPVCRNPTHVRRPRK